MLYATRVGPIAAYQSASRHQRLGAVDSVPRRLEVHSRVGSQLEPDLTAALERAIGEQSPQLRQQRRERQVGS